jgi:hypothetical protein
VWHGTALETDERDMNAQDCTLQNVTVARFRHRTNFLRSTGSDLRVRKAGSVI